MNPQVSQFLSYGNQATLNFFESAGAQLVRNPIEGLKIFGEKWTSFGQVVGKLSDSSDIASALSRFPNAVLPILEYGSKSIDILKQRVQFGDNLTDWLKGINESPAIGRGIFQVASREYVESTADAGKDLIAYGRVIALANDVENISKNLGVPSKILAIVKKHHFLEKHNLQVGPDVTKNGFFTPTLENALWWTKSAAGTLSDPLEIERFKRFLVHDYVESELMRLGLSFRSADPSIWKSTGANANANFFGAHDIAPYADTGRPPFFNWEKSLGRQPGVLNQLKTGDDLIQNIDNIVDTTFNLFK